jgi:hypothetical protein
MPSGNSPSKKGGNLSKLYFFWFVKDDIIIYKVEFNNEMFEESIAKLTVSTRKHPAESCCSRRYEYGLLIENDILEFQG